MKKAVKTKVLSQLAKELEAFQPESKGQFLCPTCMCQIPISAVERITVAHVIPKAAGGQVTTFLCVDCNSLFGRKQDKWFGEMARLTSSKDLTIMHTQIKEGHFSIDGLKVNGRWGVGRTGDLEFSIICNHNSPDTLAQIREKFAKRPQDISVGFSTPLLQNDHLVQVGLLTAAYLMWFRCVGYSWVFQSHLDMVRQQILSPEETILRGPYVGLSTGLGRDPWFGFLKLSSKYRLAFGVGQCFVSFPSHSDRQDVFSLDPGTYSVDRSDIKVLSMPTRFQYGHPTGMIYMNEALVLPDEMCRVGSRLRMVYYPDDETPPKVLRPVSDEEYERMCNDPSVSINRRQIRR